MLSHTNYKVRGLQKKLIYKNYLNCILQFIMYICNVLWGKLEEIHYSLQFVWNRRFWLRFFYLYHTAFYAYHYRYLE